MPRRVDEVRFRIECVREGVSSGRAGERSGEGSEFCVDPDSKGRRGLGRWILGEEDILGGDGCGM